MAYYDGTNNYSGTVWHHWTDSCTDSATTTGFDDIWHRWTYSSATATPATSVHRVWKTWVSDSTDLTAIKPNNIKNFKWLPGGFIPPLIHTTKPAEDKAEIKAQELLLDLIGADELAIYKKTGRLFVKGQRFDYIIRRDRMIGGLQRIEKDKISDLCVHLDRRKSDCPKTDNVIALKLAIEADENRVLRLANNHGHRDRLNQLPLAACME